MVCANTNTPECGTSGPEFRNYCRVLTASSPTGGVPPGRGGRAAPRIPPAQAADNNVGDAAAVSSRRGQKPNASR
jgi:hypothetical protein